MAIQVSGTNVITNARALNNITSIDATTAAAIGTGGVGGLSMDLVKQASNVTSYNMAAGGYYVFKTTTFFSTSTYFRITNAHSLVKHSAREDYSPIIQDNSGTAYHINDGYNHGLWFVYTTSGGYFNDWTSNSSGGTQGTNTWDVWKFT